MNPNWARWVFASVADYLKATANSLNLPSIVDGVEDRNDTFAQATDRVEIRITGPTIQELSAGYFRLIVDANVLLASRYEQKNGYRRPTLMGVFQSVMAGPIPVFKLGSEPDDDKSWIGCLSVPRGSDVKLHHFGQLSYPERFAESMCDVRYAMDLTA